MKQLIEAAKREEFVHTLKQSFEFISLKARLHANHAIAEELTSVLQASGKSIEPVEKGSQPAFRLQGEEALGEDLDSVTKEDSVAANVIPFKRLVGGSKP